MAKYPPDKVFVPGSWVKLDDLFVGRAVALTRAQQVLKSPGRNLVMYGARGLGKTTFGRHLERNLTEDNVVWVDCDRSWSLRNFIGRLLNKLEIQHEVRTRTISRGAEGGASVRVPFVRAGA